MTNVPKRWTDSLRLESRALNIQGEIQVSAVTGKGQDSGWSKVRDGLEALGFRVSSGEADEQVSAQQADEQASQDEWLAMSIDRIIERLNEVTSERRMPLTPDEIRNVLVEVLSA